MEQVHSHQFVVTKSSKRLWFISSASVSTMPPTTMQCHCCILLWYSYLTKCLY